LAQAILAEEAQRSRGPSSHSPRAVGPMASTEDSKATPPPPSDFYSRDFLEGHVKDILRFYTGRAVDKTGGYYHSYYDDGTLFNEGFRHLVASTRMVINFALSGKLLGRQDLLDMAKHGLDYVEKVHWQEDSRLYAYTLRDHKPEDMAQQSYAYAFALAMHAAARMAGITADSAQIAKVYDLLEERFWQPDFKAYGDTMSAEGILDDYRGQNSNMHICEAMIAAYDATQESRYLERAKVLAETFTQRQAKLGDGFVWEHYTKDFKIDWEYNKDDPKNIYRPWGFQPGHQIEWTKNLLNINRLEPQEWMVQRAKELFDGAYDIAWDEEHGGLVYGFGPDHKWCDDDKYFWVQAESFASAAQLYQTTGEEKYRQRYNALWRYSWEHFVDHEHGAWWRTLRRDNSKYNNEKSPAGAKCDYHTIVSCIEALRGLK